MSATTSALTPPAPAVRPWSNAHWAAPASCAATRRRWPASVAGSFQARALMDLRLDEENYVIDQMQPQEALKALEEMKDQLPEWMWKEISQVTDLRPQVQPLVAPHKHLFPFVASPLFLRHFWGALLPLEAAFHVSDIEDSLGGKAPRETRGDEIGRPRNIPMGQSATTELLIHGQTRSSH